MRVSPVRTAQYTWQAAGSQSPGHGGEGVRFLSAEDQRRREPDGGCSARGVRLDEARQSRLQPLGFQTGDRFFPGLRKWTFELYGEVWLFTDNDNFFGGKTREQDPNASTRVHALYTRLRAGDRTPRASKHLFKPGRTAFGTHQVPALEPLPPVKRIAGDRWLRRVRGETSAFRRPVRAALRLRALSASHRENWCRHKTMQPPPAPGIRDAERRPAE